MDKRIAQRLLKDKGPAFTRAQWRAMRCVLSGENARSVPTLAEQIRENADPVLAVLKNAGLCGWALHACPSLQDAPEDIRSALRHASQYEFGACAQRKLAMLELDKLAAERSCKPVVIKGAANALVFYEKESLRPSRDVDIVMSSEDIAQCFASAPDVTPDEEESHDWGCTSSFRIAGFIVEAHQFLMSPRRWGSYEDLVKRSDPLPGFAALRYPDATSAFTIALLHFAHHFGTYSFDLLDMARMAESNSPNIPEAMALWKENGLVDLILPGLTILDMITPVISEEDWKALFDSLSARKKLEVVVGLLFLSSWRFSKFRAEWFNARFEAPSFMRRVARRFLGSTKMTEQITGMSRRNPVFWLFHLFGLPLKRIAFFWK